MASQRARCLADDDARSGGTSAGRLATRAVEVLDASSVGPALLQRSRPCVLRGSSVVPRWTPEVLQARLGKQQVPLRRCVASSAQWAQLEFAGSGAFADLAAKIARGRPARPDDEQLFDFSIWQHCAETLGPEVRVPKWFCTDLFSYASGRVQPVDGSASPTLFLAAPGTGSGLHVDFLQTHFWMGLCHGRKRWRLVDGDDLPLLYPRYLADLNPVFPMDLDAAEREEPGGRFPGLRRATVHEVELEPGDVIFVPSGWPHQVSNLETSVAISANFIDGSNLAAARWEARLLGQVHEDPRLLADVLAEADASGVLEQLEASAPEDHLPLREFKARHGEPRTPQETQFRLVRSLQVALAAAAAAASYAAFGSPSGRDAPARDAPAGAGTA